MSIKTYTVSYAENAESYCKKLFVNAKTKRSAEKTARKIIGEAAIVDSIYESDFTYSNELILMNID